MPVYFARCGDDVKIGWAAVNVPKRITALQIGHPRPLIVARIVDGPRGLEGAFHRLFADRRIRGEWFRWSDDMLTADPATKQTMTPLHQAIEICGGQTALARKLGKRQSFISMALHRGGKIAAEICPAIEKATGGRVTRVMLRPDFPWAAS